MSAVEEHRMAATANARDVDEQNGVHDESGRPLEAARPRTPLAVVPAPLPSTGRGMTVLCLGILLFSLLLVLVVNITVSNRQFELLELKEKQTEVTEANELLGQRVSYLESPQNLAVRAEALGLVRASGTASVDVADQRVTGQAEAASEQEGSAMFVAPPAPLDRPVGMEELEGEALPAGRIEGPQLKDVEGSGAQDRAAETKDEKDEKKDGDRRSGDEPAQDGRSRAGDEAGSR